MSHDREVTPPAGASIETRNARLETALHGKDGPASEVWTETLQHLLDGQLRKRSPLPRGGSQPRCPP